MSARTIRILAVTVLVLFAAVWLVGRQRDVAPAEDELLFPGLEERLDGVTSIEVTDADGAIRIAREGDRWVVPAKDGYSADLTKLRELLVGLAEARKIEQKTSSPELYARIGVQDPQQEDATGVLVASEGLEGGDFAVILGDSAQREYRYVRVPDEATSWLIDRNPEVPDGTTGWLVSDIANIASSRVQSVTIRHEDGETIRIHKESEDETNFNVEGIPEGRELSYPSVANSIAAALDNLSLEDVRAADGTAVDGEAASSDGQSAADDEDSAAAPTRATAVFRTFDGLEVTVESTGTEDETWIRLAAAALPRAEDTGEPGRQPGGGAPPQATTAAGDTAVNASLSAADEGDGPASAAAPEGGVTPSDPPAEGDAATAEEAPADPGAEAAEINARVSGWEYRIPQYKATQLRRRWEDLLRAPESADE